MEIEIAPHGAQISCIGIYNETSGKIKAGSQIESTFIHPDFTAVLWMSEIQTYSNAMTQACGDSLLLNDPSRDPLLGQLSVVAR